jgi:Ca2+-binding EF-hand superfamily protein
VQTRNQILRDEQIQRVFNHIDYNQSGTIEVEELHLMFAYYGIDLSRSELVQLFNQVDKDGSGDLSLEEFKSFA